MCIWQEGDLSFISRLLFSDRAPKVIKRSLDFNAQKVAISSANIGNYSTPGYKAKQIEFESVLQSATEPGQLKMAKTDNKHFALDINKPNSMQPNIITDKAAGRMDGNNVNLEAEVTGMAEAKIAYDAAITAMSKRGSIIKSAITESR